MNNALSTRLLPAAPISTIVDLDHAIAALQEEALDVSSCINNLIAVGPYTHSGRPDRAEIAFWRDVEASIRRQIAALRDAERRERAHSAWYDACEDLAN
jgi:hypothetical protein